MCWTSVLYHMDEGAGQTYLLAKIRMKQGPCTGKNCGQPPGTNPRRSRVLLSARLESSIGQQDVRIRDLSIKGALIEAAEPPPLGEDVTLSCGDVSLKGKVAWHDEVLVGIEFTQPLTGAMLGEAEERKLQVAAPRSYRHDRMPPAEARIKTGGRVISLRKTPKGG
jgi:hypothetical protein